MDPYTAKRINLFPPRYFCSCCSPKWYRAHVKRYVISSATLIMCLSRELCKRLGEAPLKLQRSEYWSSIVWWKFSLGQVAVYISLFAVMKSLSRLSETEDGNHHSWQPPSVRLNTSRLSWSLSVFCPWSQHTHLWFDLVSLVLWFLVLCLCQCVTLKWL